MRFEHLTETTISYGDEEKYIIRLVQNLNIGELSEYLRQNPKINLTRIIDIQGYSLLHTATYKNSIKMSMLLCEYVEALI